jgi:peptidoglycan hydrolase-like protein with peptidoglycan-binding domain
MKAVSLCCVLCLTILLGGLKTTEASPIAELQTLILQLQAQLQKLQQPQPVTASSCVELSQNLQVGDTDATKNGQVGKLQQFLRTAGLYTYPTITGYYGSVTASAVSNWQSTNRQLIGVGNIQYGSIDQPTRESMAKGCSPDSSAEILTTSPIGPIVLPNKTWGETLLHFKVDAKTNLSLGMVTINLALPFVKGGNWEDMISQIILVSDKSQTSLNATSIVDNGRVISLLGEDHDDVTATFEIPTSQQSRFAVASGEDQTFTVIVDFKPASTVGGFGVVGGKNTGYVRAELVDVIDTNNQLLPVYISSYSNQWGPHRLITSTY